MIAVVMFGLAVSYALMYSGLADLRGTPISARDALIGPGRFGSTTPKATPAPKGSPTTGGGGGSKK